MPATTTIGNSRPLAACIVISQTRASGAPSASSASDSSDSRSTNPPSDGRPRAISYSRAAETSSIRFSMRPSASSLRLVAQVLQVAGAIEHHAERDRRPASPAHVAGQTERCRSRKAFSAASARGGSSRRSSAMREPRPERPRRARPAAGRRRAAASASSPPHRARRPRAPRARSCRCRAPAR